MELYSDINSKNTALLVIDVVNGCWSKKCEDKKIGITFLKIRKMVEKLNIFINDYKSKTGGKVIFVNLTPWTREYLPENIKEFYKDKNVCYYGDGSKFENDFYLLKPNREDIIVTKNNYDSFSNLKLDKILKKNKIKYLIITGVFTDGCVLATICGGFSRGYNFVIIKDLIETTDLKIRQKISKYLLSYTFPVMYGKTITSKELFKLWKKL